MWSSQHRNRWSWPFFHLSYLLFLCKDNTNVNFSHDYVIYSAFIVETSHGNNTDGAAWVLAKFVFYSFHISQSILIDACVLDSDSGLLQQVQTCCSYLPFILTHKYLMLDSSWCCSALSFNQEWVWNLFSGSDSSDMQALCSTWIF